MTWDDFTNEEKRAILKSLACIANADGDVNYAETQYFSMLLIRMNCSKSFAADAMSMWMMNMKRVIRKMSQEKKAIVRDIWLNMMNRSGGGVTFGMTVVSSNTAEGRMILSLADSCEIDVSGEYNIGTTY